MTGFLPPQGTTTAPNISTGRMNAGTIYSCWGNEIDLETVEKLMAEPGKYWANYHNNKPWWGYIVYEDDKWRGQVVLNQIVQRDFESDSVEGLIDKFQEAYPND
jgi:hypothetical protein